LPCFASFRADGRTSDDWFMFAHSRVGSRTKRSRSALAPRPDRGSCSRVADRRQRNRPHARKLQRSPEPVVPGSKARAGSHATRSPPSVRCWAARCRTTTEPGSCWRLDQRKVDTNRGARAPAWRLEVAVGTGRVQSHWPNRIGQSEEA
jgi:hypothetical protein